MPIAEISGSLTKPRCLRAEAEALRKEYADKIANAEKDAETMMTGAREEADAILDRAEADKATIVARRQKIAEDKIGAASGVRTRAKARTVMAAAAAARRLIAERTMVRRTSPSLTR